VSATLGSRHVFSQLSQQNWVKPDVSDAVLSRNTHTHPFNGSFSGTTLVSRYQKGNTNLDFCEARDSEWQWHQLGHVQVCTSLQTDNHTIQFFTGWMPFLPPNQQHQSTEGSRKTVIFIYV